VKQRKDQRQDESRKQQLQEERRIQRLREMKLHECEKEKENRQANFIRLHKERNPLKRKTLFPQEDEPQLYSLLLNGPRIRRSLTPINVE
jgi:hypothetical protein